MDPNLRKILINKILDQIKIAIIDDNKLSHFFLNMRMFNQQLEETSIKQKLIQKLRAWKLHS